MSSRRTLRVASSSAASVLFVLAVGPASLPAVAHEFAQGELLLAHPYAPSTPPGVTIAAGYLTITNEGEHDERLLGGEAAFAGNGVELHRTTVENDVARMRELDEGLLIESGQSVVLEPGGTHLMFTGLRAPLVDGERLDAVLRFERAGEVSVVFAVERRGAEAEPMDHEAMGHGDAPEAEATRETTDHGEMDHGEASHEETGHGQMGHGQTDEE